jgi:putative membrane protein
MRSLPSITAVALGALLSIPAFAQKMDNNDAAALKQLVQANLNEVEAGKLGASKAQSPAVKQFGQKMVDDHGKMVQELTGLAKRKDVAAPDKASLKDLAQMKLLELKSGADFDHEYMDHMVKDHEKDLKDVQAIAEKAKDAEFKAAVQKAIPVIQQHLQMAQRISKSAAAGSSSSK